MIRAHGLETRALTTVPFNPDLRFMSMTPELYQRIGDLYHAALELKPEYRADFIEQACLGDAELRREVESLLASHERASDFFSAPALAVAAGLLAETQLDSLVGQTISHYRILSLLGAGGMGEVYLAEDPRLGRRVAVKLLPAHLTGDRGVCPPLHAGGTRYLCTEPSEHHHHPRDRRSEGPALHRDRVCKES